MPAAASAEWVFRLPLHRTRLHDDQMRRSAAGGAVAFDRLHQWPALRTTIADQGDWAIRAFQSMQGVQPGTKQGVAPSKRSHCLFDIAKPIPHTRQHSRGWLIVSCKSALPVRTGRIRQFRVAFGRC